MELITEVGYVNGIENYSRYFDGRKPGDPPFTLIDYFRKAYGDDFVVFVDESHMTIPQVRGMFHGDRSRKQTLIDFGFRMRAALDNRPMQFDEFYNTASQFIYVSATPNPWEIDLSHRDALASGFTAHSGIVEQIIRPTGILDPEVIVRPATNEIPDLLQEIQARIQRKERVLVTTLTKKTAEDLKYYLDEKKVKAAYLHSDVHTLERSDILDGLRNNEFDVLIGVNLLREGLDLPEVTLVAILDADREGFLRSRTSLVQTMGRAARNVLGCVILYADTITDSMQSAMDEIARRRTIQIAYNTAHNIVPRTIIKPVRSKIVEKEDPIVDFIQRDSDELPSNRELSAIDGNRMTPYDTKKMIKKLESEMRRAAENLQFEVAIRIRDKIRELKG
jgi:excinuclease ABC subunit B